MLCRHDAVHRVQFSCPLGTQKTIYQLGGAVWFWSVGCEREGHVSLLGEASNSRCMAAKEAVWPVEKLQNRAASFPARVPACLQEQGPATPQSSWNTNKSEKETCVV